MPKTTDMKTGNMEILEQALTDILRQADTALAAMEAISRACPALKNLSLPGDNHRTFYYARWTKVGGRWACLPQHFATFVVDETGAVQKYWWGDDIVNPGGLLAALVTKEKERLASVARLADVIPVLDP